MNISSWSALQTLWYLAIDEEHHDFFNGIEGDVLEFLPDIKSNSVGCIASAIKAMERIREILAAMDTEDGSEDLEVSELFSKIFNAEYIEPDEFGYKAMMSGHGVGLWEYTSIKLWETSELSKQLPGIVEDAMAPFRTEAYEMFCKGEAEC